MNKIFVRQFVELKLTGTTTIEGGCKKYFDKDSNRMIPYISGQQVKRCRRDVFLEATNTPPAPVTFIAKEDGAQGQTVHSANPLYPDALFDGYMALETAELKGKTGNVKRRAPVAYSALKDFNPDSVSITRESFTYDRRGEEHIHKFIVEGDKTGEKTKEFLETRQKESTGKSLFMNYFPKEAGNELISGLFYFNVEIDLRTLCCVNINDYEKQVSPGIEQLLRDKGWVESTNYFGKCLVAPKDFREKYLPDLVHAILFWELGTNKSTKLGYLNRKYTIISDSAYKTNTAVVADENGKPEIKRENLIFEDLEEAEQVLQGLVLEYDFEKPHEYINVF